MGWWNSTQGGVWGDGPADMFGQAVKDITKQFVEAWGRAPNPDELLAGLRFTLHLPEAADIQWRPEGGLANVVPSKDEEA